MKNEGISGAETKRTVGKIKRRQEIITLSFRDFVNYQTQDNLLLLDSLLLLVGLPPKN